MFTIVETRTVLVKIQVSAFFDLNDFIELFLDNGPFSYLRELVYGIATHNYNKKIFSVNFNENTDEIIIRNFLHKYENPISLLSSNGYPITVQANTPQRPLQMVTLFPMPFSITQDQLNHITEDWGSLERYNFGRHRRFPQFRNPYLHLYFKDPNVKNIPDTIRINNRYVTVTIQGEENMSRCGYCKSKNT